jgi:hypothetical protein
MTQIKPTFVLLGFVCASLSLTSITEAQQGNSNPSAGLSRTVSLQSQNTGTNQEQAKEVVASGIGVDADSAEKQALTVAVQQAVGSYLDTKTITENEEVIKDRVLSLSNGFVSKYDVISGPKQRDDKLFEVTVKAEVQGGQIVARLKEVNLIKGDVAGQNLYAQNLTQRMNSDDACKMLNEKLPELFVNCIKMEFVDKDGHPLANSNPVDQVRDDEAQKVKCTWYIKLSVDKKIYQEQVFPLVKKCLDVMLAVKPEKLDGTLVDRQLPYQKQNEKNYHTNFRDDPFHTVVVIESISRSGDSLEGLHYAGSKYKIDRPMKGYDDKSIFGAICFSLKANSGEVIAKTAISLGDSYKRGDWGKILPLFDLYTGYSTNAYPMFYPFIQATGGCEEITGCLQALVAPITVEVSMNDFKDVSNVELQILPPKSDFKVVANPNIR